MVPNDQQLQQPEENLAACLEALDKAGEPGLQTGSNLSGHRAGEQSPETRLACDRGEEATVVGTITSATNLATQLILWAIRIHQLA